MSWKMVQWLLTVAGVVLGLAIAAYSIWFFTGSEETPDPAVLLFGAAIAVVLVVVVIPVFFIKFLQDRAIANLQRGAYANALRYTRLLQRLPLPPVGSAAADGLHGAVLLFAGQLDEADPFLRRSYETGTELKESQERREIAYLGLVNLAMTYRERGHYSEALDLYRRAREVNPEHSLSYLGEATIFIHQNEHLEEVLPLLDKAQQQEQAYPREGLMGIILVSRAWALEIMGQQQQADEALERAFQAADPRYKPRTADMHHRAGRVMLLRGDHAAARQHFNTARELDPQGLNCQLAEAALAQMDTA
jgi:tetratricopeptide (TPR) repeat protein